MKSFFLTAFVLVGLDVALHAPTTRFAQLVTAPTGWLAKWMSATTPLISAPVPGSTSSGSSGSGSGTQNKGPLGETGGGSTVINGKKVPITAM